MWLACERVGRRVGVDERESWQEQGEEERRNVNTLLQIKRRSALDDD